MRLPILALSALLAGCAVSAAPRTTPQGTAFLDALRALCGQTFPGAVVEAPAGDTLFSGRPLAIAVGGCTDDRVDIAVRVGDDESRTWIVAREGAGLRLTHVHLGADGAEDAGSRYGGATVAAGTAWRQDFPADTFSVRMVPGRATQTWTLELWPGRVLDYSLHREATGLRYRFRFDLTGPYAGATSVARAAAYPHISR